MFSSRLPWHLPENRLTDLLQTLRASGTPIVDLTVANPTQALPALYDDTMAQALTALSDPSGLRYDPQPRGLLSARQAVAAYYARRHIAVDPDQLILSASTSEAYSWLFQLLCDPGDGVLFPQPSYPLLDFLAQLASVRIVPYPLHRPIDRYTTDFVALADLIQQQAGQGGAPRLRALVIVSPNNPTGSVLHRRELAALRALAVQHDLALIIDEVFSDYALTGTSAGAGDDADGDPWIPSVIGEPAHADADPLTFVLSGLSKVVGLPQLKLGWIHVSGRPPLRTLAQDRLELIADTFLSVGTPVQIAAPRLLQQQPRIARAICDRLQHNLDQLAARVRGTAISLLPVEAGWYAVLRLPRVLSDEEWALSILQHDHVLCHPGYFFDFVDGNKAFLVISLLPPPASFATAMQRIIARVDAHLQPSTAPSP